MKEKRTFNVTVIEWLSHSATVEAANAKEAEAQARRLWDENREHDVFSFRDSGLDGVIVEEVQP